MVASGKSSYCKSAAKKGMLTINDDAVINLLHADNYTLYENNLRVLYKSVENSICSLCACAGRSILIDRGVNVSKRSRERWIAIARAYDMPCEAIVFPKSSPQIHAERRYKSDARGYSYEDWLSIAERHNSIYNEPELTEGFDMVHHITFEEITDGKVIL